MEEEEPDFELLENPARVLPAQVCSFDFVRLLMWQKCRGNKYLVAKCLNKMLMSYFRPINRTWNLRRRQVFEEKERRLSDFHIACNIAPKMNEKGSSVFTLHSCTRITVQTIKSMDIWRPHETTPRKEGECNAVPSLSSCAPCILLRRLTQ